MKTNGKTLRLKFAHRGNLDEEEYRLKNIQWANLGTCHGFPYPAAMGQYRWILEKADDGKVIRSAGYSPLFGEWKTTSAASGTKKESFIEYFHIPETRQPSRFKIQARNPGGDFADLFQMEVPPPPKEKIGASRPALFYTDPKIMDIVVGPAGQSRVDILLLSEGYAREEKRSFEMDANRFADYLFSREPYRSMRDRFNVRAMFIASEESGVSDLSTGKMRKTVLGAAYGSLGIDRYLLAHDMDALYGAAGFAPWDFLVVLCNSDRYGGGGLYNQYACYAAKSQNLQYLVPHEFSHCFAGLADEYYTAHVTYQADDFEGYMPWESNVSKLCSDGNVKWRELVDPETPIPTPWEKEEYEKLMRAKHAAMVRNRKNPSESFPKNLDKIDSEAGALLERQSYFGKVGAFEGAMYRQKNFFRPEVDCIMFSKTSRRFCRVCHQSIVRIIEAHCGQFSGGL